MKYGGRAAATLFFLMLILSTPLHAHCVSVDFQVFQAMRVQIDYMFFETEGLRTSTRPSPNMDFKPTSSSGFSLILPGRTYYLYTPQFTSDVRFSGDIVVIIYAYSAQSTTLQGTISIVDGDGDVVQTLASFSFTVSNTVEEHIAMISISPFAVSSGNYIRIALTAGRNARVYYGGSRPTSLQVMWYVDSI